MPSRSVYKAFVTFYKCLQGFKKVLERFWNVRKCQEFVGMAWKVLEGFLGGFWVVCSKSSVGCSRFHTGL